MAGIGLPTPSAEQRLLVARTLHRHRMRAVTVSVALIAATFAVFCVSISVGDFPVPLRDVVAAVFGHGNPDSDFIVRTLRMPRALNGLLVGAAFGLSGSLFQLLARNPLASPDVIGITAGSSTAAVLMIVVVRATSAAVSLGALGGALLTALAIYVLAYRRGVSSYRLVLVGIGVAAVLNAVTSYLLTRAEIFDAQRAAVWLTGSLNGRGWDELRPLTVTMALLAPLAVALARPLRALLLGDDTACGIGVAVERSKLVLTLVAVGLCAVATAAAGPVAFVAFVSGPVARRLTGHGALALVPSALVGALLLLLSDLAARRLFAPTELPVGVVTGVIGAPYLLWLIARTNRTGRAG
ncbi:MAG TPA: iron chelate uptake ABC transporter family permease subunit [Acidimicrobiales bacterium]